MLAVGLLLPFPLMLPAQVLTQNRCFDVAQLAFACDRPHLSVLRCPILLRPRDLRRPRARSRRTGQGGDEVAFYSGWFTENLITQALGMLLLRLGRQRAEGRRLGPVAWAAAALAAIGVLLPLSPLGSALGLTALPIEYCLLLIAVLVLYAGGLLAARACYERQYSPDAAER